MQFDTIQGQEKAKRILTRILAGGRLGHAFLFVGPEGVGKASMARCVANILFCTSSQKPCMQCSGCAKFTSGNHSDFIYVRPDGASIKIGQVRALKEAVTYSPFEGGYRVMLLEDVHTMRQEAGNSLLKLLEEPPQNNIMILTGDSAEAMLPTIISRCQVIPFYLLSEEVTAGILVQKKPDILQEHARMLAAITEGSPGKALSLETEGVFDVYHQFIEQVLAASSDKALQVEQALSFASTMARLKDNLTTLLHLIRVFYKNILMSEVKPHGLAIDISHMSKARELWNFKELSAKMEAVDYAEAALNRNCNKGLVCEVLMLDLFQR